MSDNLIWQQNSTSSDNGDNLDAIARWWSGIAGREVVWQQRLMPPSGKIADLDWQPQKFDEQLILQGTEIRGITLYWRNRSTDERNITPSKLCFAPERQKLYIFPQSQSQVVINVSLPATVYQKLDLLEPQIAATVKDGRGTILLRDETEKLEVKVVLNRSQIAQLLDKLKALEDRE